MTWRSRLAGLSLTTQGPESIRIALGRFLPVMGIAAAVVVLSDIGWGSWLDRLVIATAVEVAIAALTLLALRAMARPGDQRTRVLPPVIVNVALRAGALALVVSAAATRPSDLAIRFLAITVTGALWAILLIWSIEAYRSSYRLLVAEEALVAESENALERGHEALVRERRRLARAVEETMMPALDAAQTALGTSRGGDSRDSERQVALVASSARELAHALATPPARAAYDPLRPPTDSRRLSWPVVGSMARGALVTPASVPLVMVMAVLLRIPVEWPGQWPEALPVVALPALALGAVTFLSNRWLRRFPSPGPWAIAGGVLRLTVVFLTTWWLMSSLIVNLRVWPADPTWSGEPVGLLPALWMMVVVLIAAGWRWLIQDNHRALASAIAAAEQCDRSVRDQQRRIEAMRQQLSRILHGPVQGAAYAISTVLRRQHDGTRSDVTVDLDLAIVTLQNAAREIEEALTSSGSSLASLQDCLDHLAAWRGYIQIDESWQPEALQALSTDDEWSARIGETVIDAVVNAHRHGHATHVAVEVTLDVDTILVTCLDNGAGLAPSVTRGRGLARVEASAGSWSLARQGPRTVFHASIPRTRTTQPVFSTENQWLVDVDALMPSFLWMSQRTSGHIAGLSGMR